VNKHIDSQYLQIKNNDQENYKRMD